MRHWTVWSMWSRDWRAAARVAALVVFGAGLALAPVPAPRPVAAATSIVVTDGGDQDVCVPVACTLRGAINKANANPGSTITFKDGLDRVFIDNGLPWLTADSTSILGGKLNPTTNARTGFTEINGMNMQQGNALTVSGGPLNVVIANLRILNVPGDAAIYVDSQFAWPGVSIHDNAIGAAADAVVCPPGKDPGVGIWVQAGPAAPPVPPRLAIYGNTIGCMQGAGIFVKGRSHTYIGATPDLLPAPNFIGVTARNDAVSNNFGIQVQDVTDDFVIGNNVISGNRRPLPDGTFTGFGIWLDRVGSTTLISNIIGLSPGADVPQFNGGDGILITHGDHINITGRLDAPTFIAANQGNGIDIQDSKRISVSNQVIIGTGKDPNFTVGNNLNGVVVDTASSENEIVPGRNAYNNLLPIDLGGDGPTVNGFHAPPGPNNWLPYPVISDFSDGTVSGTACPNCTVVLYHAVADPNDKGGGGELLDSVTADASGVWHWKVPPDLAVSELTCVAVDDSHNTSEMSPRVLGLDQLIPV